MGRPLTNPAEGRPKMTTTAHTFTADDIRKLADTQIGNTGVFGGYIPQSGATCFRTLDGSDVRAFLEGLGFKVVENLDTGRNGLAVTACGLTVSTNGYVCRVALNK